MCIRSAGCALLAALALACAGAALAAPDFGEELRIADAIRSSDPERFVLLLEGLNDRVGEADRHQREMLDYLNAYSAAFRGDFATAIPTAIRLFEQAEDASLRFRAGGLAVNAYASSAELLQGLRRLDELLAMQASVPDAELRLTASAVAAVLFNQVGQFELGLEHAERVLAQTQVERTRCFAALYRAEALQQLGRWPAEASDMEAAALHCDASAEPALAGLLRVLIARQRVTNGQADAGLTLLLQHLPAMQATAFPRLLAEAHQLAAELYLAHGETDSAQHHATLAASQSPGIAYSRPVVSAHRILYEIAESRGELASAFAHYKRYSEADRAYLDSVKAREIAYQTVRHEIQQKDQTIELLNRRNDVLKLEQQVARTAAQNTTLLAALLALLLAAIGYWAYKTKRLQLAFRRLAETDALTGIGNRLHFTRESEAALAFCARSREPVSLVMFDLDYFKSINDHYGHATGDWVLRQVTGVVAGLCRKGDRFGRLGGEEFAILLIGCELAQAERMAESCRAAIAAIDTRPGGASFGLSASFGVASTVAAGYSLDHLLSQADQALYAAKRGGRNRVAVAREAAPSHADVSA